MQTEDNSALETRPETVNVLPGVTLSATETERFKGGYLSLTVTVPLDRESAPLYALLLAVLRRGTEKFKTIDRINLELDRLYATTCHTVNSTAGGYHTLGFSAELLDAAFVPDGTDLLGGVLAVLAGMFFTPRIFHGGFFPLYVEQEKKNAVDAIRAVVNQPASYAACRFEKWFYRDEIWGSELFGNERKIRGITGAELYSAWKKLLSGAGLHCVYVGSLTAAEVAEKLRTVLSPLSGRVRRGTDTLREGLPRIPLRPSRFHGELFTRTEHRRGGQSHLLMGFHIGVTLTDPDFYAMMLCQEILGMAPNNRLFTRVREALGICYSVSSEYLIDVGDLQVTCALDAADADRARAAVLEQIAALQENRFTDAEWEGARKSLLTTYRQIADSPKAYAGFFGIRRLFGVADTPGDCLRRFAALSREDVANAAKKIRLDTVYLLAGSRHTEKEVTDGAAENL